MNPAARKCIFWWLLLLLPAVTVGARLMAGGFFLSDDFDLLLAVRSSGPLGLWSIAQDGGFFRPLTSLSLYLDWRLWGTEPAGYFLVNTLLHGLCSLSVVWLARALRCPREMALGAGLLFAAMPCHAEPLAWIACRGDLLAALLGLVSLALALHLRGAPGYRGRLLSLLCFGGALLSKESAVTLPLVLLALELARRGRCRAPWSRALVRCLPHLGLLVAYAAARQIVIGTLVGGYGAAVHLDLAPRRVLTNLVLFPLRTLLPPVGLRWAVAALVVLCAAVALYLWRRARRNAGDDDPRPQIPVVASGIAFLLSVVPVLNLRLDPHTTEGERLLYLPSALAALCLALLLARVVRRRWLLPVLATVLLPGAVLLHHSTGKWLEAGQIAHGMTRQLLLLRPPSGAGRLVLLNVPESLRGAYIFRNGLPAALELLGGAGRGRGVQLLTFHTLASPDDEVTARRHRDRVTLLLQNPRGRFFDANAALRGRRDRRLQVARMLAAGRRRVVLQLAPPGPSDLLLHFSRGRLHRHQHHLPKESR